MLSNIKYHFRLLVKKKLNFFLNTIDYQEKYTAYGSSVGVHNISFDGNNAKIGRAHV